MRAIRPLTGLLYVLGYAAVPAWPLGVTAALLWPARVEVLLLSVASTGSLSAAVLRLLRRAQWRSEQDERDAAARDARYERLEGLLCGKLAETVSLRRDAKTRPDLRLLH
jgi:hypothetical protein